GGGGYELRSSAETVLLGALLKANGRGWGSDGDQLDKRFPCNSSLWGSMGKNRVSLLEMVTVGGVVVSRLFSSGNHGQNSNEPAGSFGGGATLCADRSTSTPPRQPHCHRPGKHAHCALPDLFYSQSVKASLLAAGKGQRCRGRDSPCRRCQRRARAGLARLHMGRIAVGRASLAGDKR